MWGEIVNIDLSKGWGGLNREDSILTSYTVTVVSEGSLRCTVIEPKQGHTE